VCACVCVYVYVCVCVCVCERQREKESHLVLMAVVGQGNSQNVGSLLNVLYESVIGLSYGKLYWLLLELRGANLCSKELSHTCIRMSHICVMCHTHFSRICIR